MVDPSCPLTHAARLSNPCMINLYTNTHHVQQALKDAEKLMELKPDWPKSFSRKGAAQHALTRYTVGGCGGVGVVMPWLVGGWILGEWELEVLD